MSSGVLVDLIRQVRWVYRKGGPDITARRISPAIDTDENRSASGVREGDNVLYDVPTTPPARQRRTQT